MLRPMRPTLALSAIVSSFLALAACTELAEVPNRQCGNYVQEEGEVCDSAAAFDGQQLSEGAPSATKICAKPGTANECQWICGTAANGAACPAGFRCGVDGVCRAPSGTFDVREQTLPAFADLVPGDLDGDGRTDLMVVNGGPLEAFYFDNNADISDTVKLPISAPVIKLGKLGKLGSQEGADPTEDLILPVPGGIGVLLSQTDRTLESRVFGSVAIPGNIDEIVPIAMEVLPGQGPGGAYRGHETLTFLHGKGLGGAELNLLSRFPEVPNEQNLVDFVAPGVEGTPSDLIFPPLTGDLLENKANPELSCEELVLVFRGKNQVFARSPCVVGPDGTVSWALAGEPAKKTSFVLPDGGKATGRGFLVDINLDGHLDITLQASCSPDQDDVCQRVVMAFGVGNGTFHSGADVPTMGDGDGKAVAVFDLPSSPPDIGEPGMEPSKQSYGPVAWGDLDEDGVPDLVLPDQVMLLDLSTAPASLIPAAYTNSFWTEAVIADFNGDGHVDVLGASNKEPGLGLLLGTGDGYFARFNLNTEHPVHSLTVGDFDGDTFADVVFVERTEAVACGDAVPPPSNNDVLSVAYGSAAVGLEDPVELGNFTAVESIATGRFRAEIGGLSTVDATWDMIVSTRTSTCGRALAVLSGDTGRLLVSPLVLVETPEAQETPEVPSSPDFPSTIALGDLDGDASYNDLAVLADNFDSTLGTPNLWIVRNTGDASLDAPVLVSFDVDEGSIYVQQVMTTIDVDGDGGAEEIIVFGTRTDTGDAVVWLVRLTQDGWKAGSPQSWPSLSFGVNGVIKTDLDGNNKADLVGWGYTFTNEEVFTAGIVLFRDGELATPEFYEVDLDYVIDIAAIDLDASPGKELIVMGYDSEKGTVKPLIADFDETGSIQELEPIEGLEDSSLLGAKVGDFNGDGVDDIAILSSASRILRGRSTAEVSR